MKGTDALRSATNGDDGERRAIAAFSGFLERYKPQLTLALPRHMSVDRIARLAVAAYSSSEDLRECDTMSIIAGVMTSAMLGLEIGVDGQGFLIPFKKVCQFVPGWKGLIDLVSRSGRGVAWTGAVFRWRRIQLRPWRSALHTPSARRRSGPGQTHTRLFGRPCERFGVPDYRGLDKGQSHQAPRPL